MAEKTNAKGAGKIKPTLRLFFGLAIFATMVPQPAKAQMAVTDPIMDALNLIQDGFNQATAAIAGISGVIAQALIAVQNAMNTNVASFNARMNTQYALAGQIAIRQTRPTNYSWCHEMQSTLTASNNQVADNAARIALIKANKDPMADPVVNSQVLLNECTLCFAPVYNANDPDYSSWINICGGAGQCPNANHVKQDTDASAVTAYNEYLVDPAYPAQQQLSGVYTPMGRVSADKYYPFVAALTFCQHLVPYKNRGPRDTPNSGVSLADLGQGPRLHEGATTSTAADMCMASLTKRMQFDNTTNWPAGNANPGAGIVTRHDEQYQQCVEDNANHRLDDGLLADCKINGRSQLQADHDKVFARGMATAQVSGAALSSGEQEQQNAQWQALEDHWGEKINTEQEALYNAIDKASGSTGQGQTDQPTN